MEMSDRWLDRSSVQALYRPPRRALLAAGSVAVPASVLVGGDLTTAGFIGLSALAAFFMGHIERGMHGNLRRNSDRNREHNTSESAAYRPQKTTTAPEED